MTDCVVLF